MVEGSTDDVDAIEAALEGVRAVCPLHIRCRIVSLFAPGPNVCARFPAEMACWHYTALNTVMGCNHRCVST